jgi:hypothetical protein
MPSASRTLLARTLLLVNLQPALSGSAMQLVLEALSWNKAQARRAVQKLQRSTWFGQSLTCPRHQVFKRENWRHDDDGITPDVTWRHVKARLCWVGYTVGRWLHATTPKSLSPLALLQWRRLASWSSVLGWVAYFFRMGQPGSLWTAPRTGLYSVYILSASTSDHVRQRQKNVRSCKRFFSSSRRGSLFELLAAVLESTSGAFLFRPVNVCPVNAKTERRSFAMLTSRYFDLAGGRNWPRSLFVKTKKCPKEFRSEQNTKFLFSDIL